MKKGEFIIRPAGEGDISAMLDLWSGVKEIQSTSVPDHHEQVKCFLELNPTSFLVACREDRLVGTIMGGYNGWRGSIYHLVVESSCRGQGIAKQLMLCCLEALRQLGAPRVDLTTYAYNTRAQDFYDTMGFKERDDIKNYSYLYGADAQEPE